MKITINNEAVDYTLEEEKNLGEVLHSISSWLQERGWVVSGLKIDEETTSLKEDQWKKTPVDTVKMLGLEVLTRQELQINNLGAARDYFALMRQTVETEDKAALAELSQGFAQLLNVLPHLLEERDSPVLTLKIASAFSKTGFPLLNASSEVLFNELAAETAGVNALILERIQELENPRETAVTTVEALHSLEEGLSEVALLLHTGKDLEAMNTIILLTELLQKLLRTLSWIQAGKAAEKMISGLTAILAELEGALKSGDTVLVGDLLEYEMKPRLQELPQRLRETLETLEESKN